MHWQKATTVLYTTLTLGLSLSLTQLVLKRGDCVSDASDTLCWHGLAGLGGCFGLFVKSIITVETTTLKKYNTPPVPTRTHLSSRPTTHSQPVSDGMRTGACLRVIHHARSRTQHTFPTTCNPNPNLNLNPSPLLASSVGLSRRVGAGIDAADIK
jgi:hypothetical protein